MKLAQKSVKMISFHLTNLMFSSLINFLLFREKKADVEAPVFLTGNAVESAHSKLFTLKPVFSISQQITRMWRTETIKIGSEGQHIQNTLLIKQ